MVTAFVPVSIIVPAPPVFISPWTVRAFAPAVSTVMLPPVLLITTPAPRVNAAPEFMSIFPLEVIAGTLTEVLALTVSAERGVMPPTAPPKVMAPVPVPPVVSIVRVWPLSTVPIFRTPPPVFITDAPPSVTAPEIHSVVARSHRPVYRSSGGVAPVPGGREPGVEGMGCAASEGHRPGVQKIRVGRYRRGPGKRDTITGVRSRQSRNCSITLKRYRSGGIGKGHRSRRHGPGKTHTRLSQSQSAFRRHREHP